MIIDYPHGLSILPIVVNKLSTYDIRNPPLLYVVYMYMLYGGYINDINIYPDDNHLSVMLICVNQM